MTLNPGNVVESGAGRVNTGTLNAWTYGGAISLNGANTVASFTADTSWYALAIAPRTGFDVSFNNQGVLSLDGIYNPNGNVTISNVGAMTVNSVPATWFLGGVLPAGVPANAAIYANGNISLVAHSPLTINGVVGAGGNVALEAGATPGGINDNLTINAAVTSAGSVSLIAGNSILGASNVTAAGGVTSQANLNNATNTSSVILNAACVTNPLLCNTSNTTTMNSTSTAPVTVHVTNSLMYNNGVLDSTNGQLSWIVYSDVRKARNDARSEDDSLETLHQHVAQAKSSEEREAAQNEYDSKKSESDKKHAEAKRIESESEKRSAETEVRTAKTSDEKVRAEVRLKIAESKNAEAEVSKSDAEARAAAVEAKTATDPAVKAQAETRVAVAIAKKNDAEIRKADIDVHKAEAEAKQANIDASNSKSPDAVANAESKQAVVEVKKADAEIKRAEVVASTSKDPVVKAKAEDKIAASEVSKATAESKQLEVEAKQAKSSADESGDAGAHHVAQLKQSELDVKKGDVEVKAANLEARHAKDPVAKAAAEEKVANAELAQAKAEVEHAKAQVEAQGGDGGQRGGKSAGADEKHEVAKANLEAKLAKVEAKEAAVEHHHSKDSEGSEHSEVAKLRAEAKQAAAEAKSAAKEAEVAANDSDSHSGFSSVKAVGDTHVAAVRAVAVAKMAESEVKMSGAAMKMAEIEMKTAKTPEARAAAERVFEQKKSEYESKVTKLNEVKVVAERKNDEYKVVKASRDQKVIEGFAGVDLGGAAKGRVQELMVGRHEFMKESLEPALQILAANPKAAALKSCSDGGGDVCIKVAPAVGNTMAEILPKTKVEWTQPKLSYLPEIQRKVALVIGINSYEDPKIPSLDGAVGDAQALAKVLKDKMGYDVQVVNNATRGDIVRSINKIGEETGSKDSVIVYYAGHGYQMDDTREGYWIPSDASSRSPDKWISSSDINSMLTNIPAKQVILVSDSCFSGALVGSKVTSKDVLTDPKQVLEKRSVTVMSSGGEEPVLDEGKEGHSIFAWHLLDKLAKIEQYNNGVNVFDEVRDGVVKDGGGIQTPQYGSSSNAGYMKGGDYLFESRSY
jgi:hypothetical protein